MKKLGFIVMIAFLAVAMMSCGFNSKMNQMEKACKAGDFEKAEKIANEIDEKYGDDIKNNKLSEDQMKRMEEVGTLCAQEMLKQALGGAKMDLDDMDDMDD